MITWLVWGETEEQAVVRSRHVWNRHATVEGANSHLRKERSHLSVLLKDGGRWRLFRIQIDEVKP